MVASLWRLAKVWLLILGICSCKFGSITGDGSDAEQEEIADLEAELDAQLKARHFTNQWAIHVEGGPDVAEAVARDLGYVNHGQVG